MCNDSKQRFLYTVMNASCKLQIATPLTFQPKVLTALISYRPFSFFILFVGFLHIFQSSFCLASCNPFSHPSFHRISACLHFFTLFFSSCIFFFTSFLSYFLFSFFVSLYLHFSVYILSFPLLLFLYVHYFLLSVYCVRNTLVTAQFTSVFFKPLKGIQWRWHVTAPSSEEHDVCSIYSYPTVRFQGASIELLAF